MDITRKRDTLGGQLKYLRNVTSVYWPHRAQKPPPPSIVRSSRKFEFHNREPPIYKEFIDLSITAMLKQTIPCGRRIRRPPVKINRWYLFIARGSVGRYGSTAYISTFSHRALAHRTNRGFTFAGTTVFHEISLLGRIRLCKYCRAAVSPNNLAIRPASTATSRCKYKGTCKTHFCVAAREHNSRTQCDPGGPRGSGLLNSICMANDAKLRLASLRCNLFPQLSLVLTSERIRGSRILSSKQRLLSLPRDSLPMRLTRASKSLQLLTPSRLTYLLHPSRPFAWTRVR